MRSVDHESGPLRALFNAFTSGEIDRRTFVQRATMLGVGAAGVTFLANTGLVAAQDASPEASPAGSGEVRPSVGTEGQERGAGGELRLMQWQAPTSLSPHAATGDKDLLGSMLVLEPLIYFAADSSMFPNLLAEIPSAENGGVSDDLKEVTLKLLPDVLWSDGEPFTADDVVFTIDWVKDPANNSTSQDNYDTIESAEAVDELTVKVTYKDADPLWFAPFVGVGSGCIYPKHILEGGGEDAANAFLSAPIGTGPYVVDSFTPNDQVNYVMNENYREANKPFFSSVQLKGGGDAAAAARSVLQTGEFDYAWNLQVEPDVLEGMTTDDATGVLVPFPGTDIERFNFNFSDPNKEVDGQKSEMNTPHPFFSDDAVRQAVATSIDRQKIADELWGLGQRPAGNVIYGDPRVESPNTSWTFDLDQAAQILEDAGWVLNDNGVREKDGVEIKMVYATTVNSVRQKTQAVIKQDMESIGMQVNIESLDSGIFFDSSAGNDQNVKHFYWDANEYRDVPNSPRPLGFLHNWYTGPDGENIAQKSNDWTGSNTCRWQNAEYDALYDQALTEADADVFADLFIQMNDMIIMNNATVPLVVVGTPRGVSKRLRAENIALSPFSYDYWNIANWNLADDAAE